MYRRKKAGCGSMFLGCLVSVTAFAVMLVIIDVAVRVNRQESARKSGTANKQYPPGPVGRLQQELEKSLGSEGPITITIGKNKLDIVITGKEVPIFIPSEAEFQYRYTRALRGIRDSGFDDFSTVEFTSFVPLNDKFGNTKLYKVCVMSFDKSNLDRINWEHFLHVNLTAISSDYWFHPSVKRRE